MGTFTYDDSPVRIAPTENIVLERKPLPGRGDPDAETFILHRTIDYHDSTTGQTYRVPPDPDFETDLASVPQVFRWLIPKSGRHLDAALIHDALVRNDDVDGFEADRIFRDGMGDLHVGLIRRWLMWAAVSTKTIRERGSLRLKAGAVATGLIVLLLGGAATVSLFVERTVVPWMASESWWAELATGLAGAVVIPIALALVLWSPIRMAGVILGVAAAVLLHVTVLLGLLYYLYRWLERRSRPTLTFIGAGVLTAAVIVFGIALGQSLT